MFHESHSNSNDHFDLKGISDAMILSQEDIFRLIKQRHLNVNTNMINFNQNLLNQNNLGSSVNQYQNANSFNASNANNTPNNYLTNPESQQVRRQSKQVNPTNVLPSNQVQMQNPTPNQGSNLSNPNVIVNNNNTSNNNTQNQQNIQKKTSTNSSSHLNNQNNNNQKKK